MRRAAIVVGGGAAMLACAAAARAETNRSFQLSATIANGCSVSSAAGSEWGSIDLGGVAGSTVGTVEAGLVSGGVSGLQLDCTPGMTVAITADSGLNGSGGTRQLAYQVNRIGYQLFAGSGGTAWTTQAISLSFPTGTARQVLPVVAKASLNGTAPAGSYSDTVQITLAW